MSRPANPAILAAAHALAATRPDLAEHVAPAAAALAVAAA